MRKKKISPVCVSLGNGSSEAVDKVHTSLLLPRSIQTVFHAAAIWDQERKGPAERNLSSRAQCIRLHVFL